LGFLITLLLSVVFGALGVLRPKAAAFLLLALFVLFDELGAGFTTYTGSFVFNAEFVGFAGFRLVEIITVSAYIPILMMSRQRPLALTAFGAERWMFWLFAVLIAVLTLVEYMSAATITVSNWRLILTGAMQFHMLVLLFRTEDDIKALVKVFLVLVAIKCAWGLAMWAAGMGTMSPRGRLPFFWDSRQVEAFGLGLAILTAYLLNFKTIDPKHRILPAFWAAMMWVVMLAAVMGSIRRTIWVSTLAAAFLVLVVSRRTTVLHYLAVVGIVSTTVAALMMAPGLDSFRDHMGRYVQSMNLFDDYQRGGNIDNDVHLDNVEKYSLMIIENPDIMAFGTFGPSGLTYDTVLRRSYSGMYPLGMAHNGLLRTTLFFGLVGLLIYIAFHYAAASRLWRIHRVAPDEHLLTHVAMASGLTLLVSFAAALLFVPPFWTSSKGLYYTFLEVFFIGITASLLARGKRRPSAAAATTGARPTDANRGRAAA
jgi:hypothetical protein